MSVVETAPAAAVRLRITEAGGDTVEHDLVTAWARPTPVAPPAPQAPPAGPPAAGAGDLGSVPA